MKQLRRLHFIAAMCLTAIGGILTSGQAAVMETIEVETNPIPDIRLPETTIKPGERLKVFICPFERDTNKFSPSKVEASAMDQMELVASATRRLRLFDDDSTNCDYRLEGFIRNFQVTKFSSGSDANFTKFFQSAFMSSIKVQGAPVPWGTVDWSSTNSIVRLDCELTLKFKRARDKELLKICVGKFTRVSMVKNMAAELAGVKINSDALQKENDADKLPSVADGDYIENRVIQIVMAKTVAQLITAIDDEIAANREEKAAK